ncbi:MAG: glycosyltransferase, partial [Gemmataceae bacterium]
MRISVVINTYNRGPSLRNTLQALRFQNHRDFEVVVVNGPSRDETADVLDEFAEMIRVYSCPDVHLSKSRNIGIAHASGDVVAFIDDDAIPEPDWLAGLSKAYDSEVVGGVGGLVYDHTGASYQYEYSACSRVAVPRFDLKPPLSVFNRPGADPFLYLQGTNCSFRRSVLLEIGGFNEEIEYYLDETEVCMRTIDAGYELRSLSGAAVHHKYLPSHIRNNKRVVFDPYSSVKNHCTFAVRNGTRTRPMSEVLHDVSNYVNAVKAGGRANRDAGRMTDDQLSHYLRRTEQAMEFGVRQGLTQPRPIRNLPAPKTHEFLHFPLLNPATGRLKVCFVSREYPPDRGGIGRFTTDLAEGYGKLGHEVHVVTHSKDGHTVDFENGVWVHRLPDIGPKGDRFKHLPLAFNYTHAANVYHEVRRIHENCGGLDLVSAPIWLCEGAICALDSRWPTVLTLHTTMKTIAAMGGTNSDPAHVRDLIALEAATVQQS